jgi:N-acetyl-anhydromuramyl-L-alanine amidase AmpD
LQGPWTGVQERPLGVLPTCRPAWRVHSASTLMIKSLSLLPPMNKPQRSTQERMETTATAAPIQMLSPQLRNSFPAQITHREAERKLKWSCSTATEASLNATIEEFKNANGRQVSAHYVIDDNGDIYQMVQDSERTNHARGANRNSIGIEHVRAADQPIADEQVAASAALIRWLLAQYGIPRSEIYGHDFAPGYDHSRGGTSCPETVANWVANNV